MSQDPYGQQPYQDPNQPQGQYPDPNQQSQYYDPNQQQAYPASAQSAGYPGQQQSPAGYDASQYAQQYPQSAQSASYPQAGQAAQPQYAAAPPAEPGAISYIFKPDFSKSGVAKLAPLLQLGALIGGGLWYLGTVASFFYASFGYGGYGTTDVNGYYITVAILFLLVGWVFPLVVTGLVRVFLEFATAVIETNAARKESASS